MRTLQFPRPAVFSLGRSTTASKALASAPLLTAFAGDGGTANSMNIGQQLVDRPTKKTVRSFMKISRSFALLLFTASLLGLGGCSTFTPKDMLAQFEPGEQPLYGVVAGKPRKLHELSDYKEAFLTNCGEKEVSNVVAPTFNQWIKKNVCSDLTKWQFVPLVYHTKVWGMKGLKYTRAYAPVEWNIEEDDILELSMDTSKEGQKLRPNTVKRIARKAKEATKESGCWWDGGKGATSAFISGGAVCDGWNWKNQKFANE